MSRGRSRKSKTPLTQEQAAIKHGWRSGLEEQIGSQLDALGVAYRFEEVTIPYTQPEKPRKYTPDFILPNGIVVESKGRFETADRQKMLLIKQQYPKLDIRFVFSNPNGRISKLSKTTYANWSDKYEFPWAKQKIPGEWLDEPPNVESLETIRKLERN